MFWQTFFICLSQECGQVVIPSFCCIIIEPSALYISRASQSACEKAHAFSSQIKPLNQINCLSKLISELQFLRAKLHGEEPKDLDSYKHILDPDWVFTPCPSFVFWAPAAGSFSPCPTQVEGFPMVWCWDGPSRGPPVVPRLCVSSQAPPSGF